MDIYSLYTGTRTILYNSEEIKFTTLAMISPLLYASHLQLVTEQLEFVEILRAEGNIVGILFTMIEQTSSEKQNQTNDLGT